MLTVGDKIPKFKLQAVVSLESGQEFREITHESFAGKCKVIFLWPMDFTFAPRPAGASAAPTRRSASAPFRRTHEGTHPGRARLRFS